MLQRLAALRDVLLQLRGVPLVVGRDDVAVPVLLDEVLDKLSVSRRWVRDVVV
jgi:hypothetical protein